MRTRIRTLNTSNVSLINVKTFYCDTASRYLKRLRDETAPHPSIGVAVQSSDCSLFQPAVGHTFVPLSPRTAQCPRHGTRLLSKVTL